MKTLLIGLSPERIPEEEKQKIHALANAYNVVITDHDDEIKRNLKDIEIAAAHFPIQWIPQASSLRWYQQWGAGTDWLMKHPEIAKMDFTLTNASGVHAIPISEHILALMLAFSRRLPDAFRGQASGQWTQIHETEELSKKTLLLIGVGAIGKQTARIASAFGMHVIGMRRHPGKAVHGIEKMVGQDQLHQILPDADFIVLTIPLTAETRHMLDEKAFQSMKTSAYIINIGRGATIDEAALIQALRDRKIAGAGLDVFEQEPLPADSPLWKMENVIITAHYSGNTPMYDQRALEIFIDNLKSYLNGSAMRNIVDKTRGY